MDSLHGGPSGNKTETQSNLRGLSNKKKEVRYIYLVMSMQSFSLFLFSLLWQYEEVSKNQSFAITQSLFGWNESSAAVARDFSHVYINEKDPADISGNYLFRI